MALGGARRFKVCDYTDVGMVIVKDLAEGLVQGLRPVTGKDILKLGQNGKRVTNVLAENDRQALRAARSLCYATLAVRATSQVAEVRPRQEHVERKGTDGGGLTRI